MKDGQDAVQAPETILGCHLLRRRKARMAHAHAR